MSDYATPGVYVEEISTLAPSVVQVATAIPAFIGYTEKHEGENPIVKRITSLLDFVEIFGGPPPVTVTLAENSPPEIKLRQSTFADGYESFDTMPDYLLYYALRLYFLNGGGDCFVVSVGAFGADGKVSKTTLADGLTVLEKEDEPTLIVLTDAIGLGGDYLEICQTALSQCHDLADRFAIFDVLQKSDQDAAIGAFRGISSDYLSYGAAYYPYLRTTIPLMTPENRIEVTLVDESKKTLADLGADENASAQYAAIKAELDKVRIVLPPSAAIAGIYARVDRDRGVWKAPANVSVNGVSAPTVKITDKDQKTMNVHESGKSINAIRSFTGRGILVWGARTLFSNSNEWRYVPVRRLFITIEESAQKASKFAVFEPNNATTWLKVKAMIDSYLYGLWSQGAFFGATPEAAYEVNVGVGKTMTQDDVLNGRLIVEIKIAAVRPAEFIVLRFMHLVQPN